MKLTPPTKNTFYISVLLLVLGLLGELVAVPFVSDYAFWFAFIGGAVLVLGNYMKGF